MLYEPEKKLNKMIAASILAVVLSVAVFFVFNKSKVGELFLKNSSIVQEKNNQGDQGSDTSIMKVSAEESINALKTKISNDVDVDVSKEDAEKAISYGNSVESSRIDIESDNALNALK